MKKEEKKVVVSKKEPTSRKKYVAESNKTIKKKASHESIFKKISKYFKGVVKEGKKVRGTNGKDLVKYSIAAVVFVIFFGIYFYAIDWISLLIRSLAK